MKNPFLDSTDQDGQITESAVANTAVTPPKNRTG